MREEKLNKIEEKHFSDLAKLLDNLVVLIKKDIIISQDEIRKTILEINALGKKIGLQVKEKTELLLQDIGRYLARPEDKEKIISQCLLIKEELLEL